jgi:hypothetical protein
MGGPSVPWSLVAPHEGQARNNHDQSLDRLAERGGLSPSELWCVVLGKHWRERPADDDVSLEWLRTWLAQHEGAAADRDRLAARVAELESALVRSGEDWQEMRDGRDALRAQLTTVTAERDLTSAEALDEIERLRGLLIEVLDIAKRKREIKTQIADNYFDVARVGPSPDEQARLAAIRHALNEESK